MVAELYVNKTDVNVLILSKENGMDFSKTYLYRLHKLTNALDRAFDQTLRNHTEIGLSQFSLLYAISQFQSVNQRKLADFLEVSTPAVSRQVDIAKHMGWLEVTPSLTNRHGNSLLLTRQGKVLVKIGVETLEQHLFKVFTDHNKQTNLMEHIDLLLKHTKGVVKEQTVIKHTHAPINIYERVHVT